MLDDDRKAFMPASLIAFTLQFDRAPCFFNKATNSSFPDICACVKGAILSSFVPLGSAFASDNTLTSSTSPLKPTADLSAPLIVPLSFFAERLTFAFASKCHAKRTNEIAERKLEANEKVSGET